jgi:hypothetical protein
MFQSTPNLNHTQLVDELQKAEKISFKYCTEDDILNHFNSLKEMLKLVNNYRDEINNINICKKEKIKKLEFCKKINKIIDFHLKLNKRELLSPFNMKNIKRIYNVVLSKITTPNNILKLNIGLFFKGSLYIKKEKKEKKEKISVMTMEPFSYYLDGISLNLSRRQGQMFDNKQEILSMINSKLENCKINVPDNFDKNYYKKIANKPGEFNKHSLIFIINKGDELNKYQLKSNDNRLLHCLGGPNHSSPEITILNNWVKAKVIDYYISNKKSFTITWFPCLNIECLKLNIGNFIKLGLSTDKLLLNCTNCKSNKCSICNNEYHGNTNCDAMPEEQSAQAVINHTKPCPICNHRYEKLDSCNHMTCKKCIPITDWCWCCGEVLDFKEYPSGHPESHYCYGHIYLNVPFENGKYKDCIGKNIPNIEIVQNENLILEDN